MSLTRSSLRTRALQAADAESSPRWDSVTMGALGEVDQHMGIVHAREWRRILAANPYHRVSSRAVTIDTSGRIAIADLSVPSTGDLQERFHRVLLFSVANTVLRETPAKDGFMATLTSDAAGLGYGFYFRQGDYFIAPGHVSEAATIWVNHIPTRADNLSLDSVSVIFPDDYEDILAFETAALLLSKGAAEMDAVGSLKGLAEDMRRDMLQDITRTSINPLLMQFPDTAAEWAG